MFLRQFEIGEIPLEQLHCGLIRFHAGQGALFPVKLDGVWLLQYRIQIVFEGRISSQGAVVSADGLDDFMKFCSSMTQEVQQGRAAYSMIYPGRFSLQQVLEPAAIFSKVVQHTCQFSGLSHGHLRPVFSCQLQYAFEVLFYRRLPAIG